MTFSRLIKYFLFTWLLIFFSVIISTSVAVGQTTKGSKISIHSENNQVIDATFDPPTQYLNGDVKVYHEGTYMYCDTAHLKGSELKMYFNVVLLQNDSIKIFADSLHYDGDSLFAYLYGDIILENGPDKKLYTSYLKYDVKNKIGYYTKNAKLVDKTSTLISRYGRYFLNEKTAYFYENVQIIGDGFNLTGDSLAYNTVSQMATFLSPVRINKDSSQIFSEKGWFDLDDKRGDFIGNAQYKEGSTLAKSDTITYDGEMDIVVLKGDAQRSEYISDKDTAYAKVIYYDQKNELFRLTTDAWYKGDKNEVRGESIFYNKKTEKFNVAGRSVVSDPPYIIEGDSLDYDKSIKFGKADGHVVWRDTAARTAIISDHVLYKGEDNFMKATNDVGRPMFITEIDGDTLFMKADTLRSFRIIRERLIFPDKNAARRASKLNKETLQDSVTQQEFSNEDLKLDNEDISQDSTIGSVEQNKPDSILISSVSDTIFTGIMDTLDYFIADNNARIFKSDMQAVCDSLVFSNLDSMFTLLGDPFVWSDTTQIAGDTIDILLKSRKIDQLKVRSSATIINSEDLKFFNQIKGRTLDAYFKESKIYRMDVNGNAQLVYYMLDKEKAYTGVNTTECSHITFLLDDNKMTDIRNYVEPKSKVLPMKGTDHEALKIKGFKWNISSRPKSVSDL